MSVPDFAPLLGSYLARQYWAQSALGAFGESSVPATITDVAVLRHEHPGMASIVVECGPCRFHLVVGWRATSVAPAVFGAHSDAVLGAGRDEQGEVLVYDFLADRQLALLFLQAITSSGQSAARARVVKSLVSHSSLVYDDRLFMKCYRVIEAQPRPEVEVLSGLDSVGFNHMLAPVAIWRRHGHDLALVREYVPSAVEGIALARTSLRDLLARVGSDGTVPTSAVRADEIDVTGGDLAPEMRRLGATTGRMHVALAEAFGTESLITGARAIRIHGDYHLRRVMRADGGWLVTGFGDDPLMGESAGAGSQAGERRASPLEDVADFCRSLGWAATEAVGLQDRSQQAASRRFADAWRKHNVAAFLKGYLSFIPVTTLLPPAGPDLEAALAGAVAAGGTDRASTTSLFPKPNGSGASW